MSNRTKTPNIDFSTVLDRVIQIAMRDINCMKIGTIESFDKTNQTASVKITMKRLLEISSKGVKSYREFPLLVEVPCFVLSGGGSYLEMPIKAKDTCLLFFSDEDLEDWITTNETAPCSARRHDLSDAVCIVGINNLTKAFSDFEGDKIKLQFSSSVSLIMDNDGTKIKNDVEVDGKIKATGEIAAPTMKPANGFTGAIAPTNSITVLNGIITAIA